MRLPHIRFGTLAFVCALFILPPAAGVLADRVNVTDLVLINRVELPRIIIQRAAWLPNNRHIVLGGWIEWPNVPIVTLAPNDLPIMQVGSHAASPHFALSPDGTRLAFWKRVMVGERPNAELTIVNLTNEIVSTLGRPLEISGAMHLSWPVDSALLYAVETGGGATGALYVQEVGGGAAQRVLELQEGSWQGLERAPGAPGEIIATWSGAVPAVYRVNALEKSAQPVAEWRRAVPSPTFPGRTLERTADGSLLLTISATEGVVVERGVHAARWRADGSAILFVTDHELWAAGADGEPRRKLDSVADEPLRPFLRGCEWSPDGSSVVYWGTSGMHGRGWRANIGMERVTARFAFPQGAQVKAGDRIWVAMKFQTDGRGQVTEPVWSTLKALFVATRILRTPEGIEVESVSVGEQPGVIERLVPAGSVPTGEAGHIRIGIGGETVPAWTRAESVRMMPGLKGWLHGTSLVGEPVSLTIERQALPPVTTPAAAVPGL